MSWEELVKCPNCGHVGDVQTFDVLGADPGCLFCNECGHHGVMPDVEVAPDVTAEAPS